MHSPEGETLLPFGWETGAKERVGIAHSLPLRERQAVAGLGLTRFNNSEGLWSTKAVLENGLWVSGEKVESKKIEHVQHSSPMHLDLNALSSSSSLSLLWSPYPGDRHACICAVRNLRAIPIPLLPHLHHTEES